MQGLEDGLGCTLEDLHSNPIPKRKFQEVPSGSGSSQEENSSANRNNPSSSEKNIICKSALGLGGGQTLGGAESRTVSVTATARVEDVLVTGVETAKSARAPAEAGRFNQNNLHNVVNNDSRCVVKLTEATEPMPTIPSSGNEASESQRSFNVVDERIAQRILRAAVERTPQIIGRDHGVGMESAAGVSDAVTAVDTAAPVAAAPVALTTVASPVKQPSSSDPSPGPRPVLGSTRVAASQVGMPMNQPVHPASIFPTTAQPKSSSSQPQQLLFNNQTVVAVDNDNGNANSNSNFMQGGATILRSSNVRVGEGGTTGGSSGSSSSSTSFLIAPGASKVLMLRSQPERPQAAQPSDPIPQSQSQPDNKQLQVHQPLDSSQSSRNLASGGVFQTPLAGSGWNPQTAGQNQIQQQKSIAENFSPETDDRLYESALGLGGGQTVGGGAESRPVSVTATPRVEDINLVTGGPPVMNFAHLNRGSFIPPLRVATGPTAGTTQTPTQNQVSDNTRGQNKQQQDSGRLLSGSDFRSPLQTTESARTPPGVARSKDNLYNIVNNDSRNVNQSPEMEVTSDMDVGAPTVPLSAVAFEQGGDSGPGSSGQQDSSSQQDGGSSSVPASGRDFVPSNQLPERNQMPERNQTNANSVTVVPPAGLGGGPTRLRGNLGGSSTKLGFGESFEAEFKAKTGEGSSRSVSRQLSPVKPNFTQAHGQPSAGSGDLQGANRTDPVVRGHDPNESLDNLKAAQTHQSAVQGGSAKRAQEKAQQEARRRARNKVAQEQNRLRKQAQRARDRGEGEAKRERETDPPSVRDDDNWSSHKRRASHRDDGGGSPVKNNTFSDGWAHLLEKDLSSGLGSEGSSSPSKLTGIVPTNDSQENNNDDDFEDWQKIAKGIGKKGGKNKS